jgi:ATP-dependent helicase/nuclease subunit B
VHDEGAHGETLLLVVECEAEVRWQWERGRLAVTRADLYARLSSRLLPEVTLASKVTVRLALADILAKLAQSESWLGVVLERGGKAWIDLVAGVDATLAEAHRMTWHGALGRIGDDPRSRTIAAARRDLERALSRVALADPAAEDERITRALSHAPADDVADALGARHVVASGVASWAPAELALWRALDARLSLLGGSATIELVTFERPLDAERALDPAGRLVDAVAEALDAAPKTRPIVAVLGDLGGGDTLTEDSLLRVELRTADSPRAEARAIADAVRGALSGGTPPEQVAVVVSRDAPVRGPLLRLLEGLNIPTHVVGRDEVAPGGLVTCALEALAVAGRGAPRLAVATLLGSMYIDASRLSGLADANEARTAIRGIARALERTRAVRSPSPAECLARTVLASDMADQEARSRWASVARRIGEILERAASGKGRIEHARRARDLIEALGLRAIPGPGAAARLATDLPMVGLERVEVGAFVRDARGRERLDAELDAYETAAARLALDAPTSFESFRLEIELSLRLHDATLGLADEAPVSGAMRISLLRDLPSRPLALLVFADAHGGALESRSKGATLLDAAVRTRLTESIEPALRPSVFAASDADSIRLAAAAHAARHIVISCTTRDDDGALRSPHPLVAWLELQGVRQTKWRDEVIATHPLTDDEARLAALGRAGAGARLLAPAAAERADVEARRERSFGVTARAIDAVAHGETASTSLRAILVEETGGADRAMSVTSLDRFGACRFQGFTSQVLGARSKLILAEAIGPREEGVLLHGALEAAFVATRELWSERPRDAEAIRAKARLAAAAFLGRDASTSRLVRATLDELLDRVAAVVEWSLADDGWDFLRAESGFGKRFDAWDAVLLGDGRTRLRLAGSMDRVDVSHDGACLRVVDYKRSEDGARRLTEALGESSFQLAVYASAASRALGKPVASGMYLATRRLSPAYRTRGNEAAWARAHAPDQGLARFETRALSLMRAVREGDVEPRPVTADACRWCDHDGACRKPRFVIESAASEDADDARVGA